DTETVKNLIKNKNTLNYKAMRDEISPLFYAVALDREEIVKELLQGGANPSVAVKTITPLTLAASRKNTRIFQLIFTNLKENNILDPSACDESDYNGRQIAESEANYKILQILKTNPNKYTNALRLV
ncbi:MAG: hypothetical protein KGI80_03545, partial [Verrucomicrobiota bacterium]|nr:hypothetical protein [Verrucomicrobiota bacterium]